MNVICFVPNWEIQLQVKMFLWNLQKDLYLESLYLIFQIVYFMMLRESIFWAKEIHMEEMSVDSILLNNILFVVDLDWIYAEGIFVMPVNNLLVHSFI